VLFDPEVQGTSPLILVLQARIELATPCTSSRYSTTELPEQSGAGRAWLSATGFPLPGISLCVYSLGRRGFDMTHNVVVKSRFKYSRSQSPLPPMFIQVSVPPVSAMYCSTFSNSRGRDIEA
jgi:hypothetical protein